MIFTPSNQSALSSFPFFQRNHFWLKCHSRCCHQNQGRAKKWHEKRERLASYGCDIKKYKILFTLTSSSIESKINVETFAIWEVFSRERRKRGEKWEKCPLSPWGERSDFSSSLLLLFFLSGPSLSSKNGLKSAGCKPTRLNKHLGWPNKVICQLSSRNLLLFVELS